MWPSIQVLGTVELCPLLPICLKDMQPDDKSYDGIIKWLKLSAIRSLVFLMIFLWYSLTQGSVIIKGDGLFNDQNNTTDVLGNWAPPQLRLGGGPELSLLSKLLDIVKRTLQLLLLRWHSIVTSTYGFKIIILCNVPHDGYTLP